MFTTDPFSILADRGGASRPLPVAGSPSSGSFGHTFPSRGKALYVPTFPAQRLSDNETSMMRQAEQYNARFSIRAVREYM